MCLFAICKHASHSICHASPQPPHSVHPEDNSTLHFLSFSDIPHIHLTIIRSVLSRFGRSAFFTAQVSVTYVNTIWTKAFYIFPFMLYEAPRAVTVSVRIGDNSLNLAQAHLTLALAASSTPFTSKKKVIDKYFCVDTGPWPFVFHMMVSYRNQINWSIQFVTTILHLYHGTAIS